jgi:hypothetical protein
MDIYGSFYADETSPGGSPEPASAPLPSYPPPPPPDADAGGGGGTAHPSMYADTGDTATAEAEAEEAGAEEEAGEGEEPAAFSADATSFAEPQPHCRGAEHAPAAAYGDGRAKPNFSILSKYQWGTNAGGDALQGDEAEAGGGFEVGEGEGQGEGEGEGEEVECYLDGEDDIVLLGPAHTHTQRHTQRQQSPPSRSGLGALGSGIYRVANDSIYNTAQKAGDVIYYATNSVSEKSSALMIEAKATLSRGSDVAVISLAGGAAAETLLFAVDRSRLLGMQLVHSLRGDPEVARRLHLRRLLASGSWAEFSAKCQLATLPWYTRQLIHLTRYDSMVPSSDENIKESRGKKLARASQGAGAAASGAAASNKAQRNKQPEAASAASYPGEGRGRGKGPTPPGDGLDDPMQMDTLLLSEADVQYLNGATRQAASDAQDRKEETAGLTDNEFHMWILAKAQEGSADAEYALSKWFTPPSFTESGSCYACRMAFGYSKFRHHCRHCGKSFCGDHSSETRSILKYGFTSPVRVCDTCAYTIDRESRMDRQMWKQERLTDYAHSVLVPYFEVAEDRGVDKAYR